MGGTEHEMWEGALILNRKSVSPKELVVAKEVSERLGYYTYKSRSQSRKNMEGAFNGSISISDQRRALMLPQELLLLPAADMIVLRSGMPPVQGKRIRYYEDRELAARTAIEAGKPRPRPIDREAMRKAVARISAEEGTMEISDEEALSPIAPSRLVAEFLPEDFADDPETFANQVLDELIVGSGSADWLTAAGISSLRPSEIFERSGFVETEESDGGEE